MIHCKKCNGRTFKDISSLRRHQWTEHTEMFDKLRAAAKVSRKGRPAIARQAKPLVKLEPSPNGRGPLLASDLLTQLQAQHRFLSDVVSLISGIISQHEENK